MLIVACILILSAHEIRSVHFAKDDNNSKRIVPLYAELDVTETSFLFTEIFSQITACGHRLVWIDRKDFSAKKEETKAHKGPIILVTTGGPSEEEKEYFRNTSQGQRIILLHPSDEFLTQTDVSMYGSGVSQVFRNYYHAGMGDETLQYLLKSSKGPVPKVLWLPLGLANLKPLPAAFRFEFGARTYLWAWAGDILGKPERIEMLQALEQHASSAQIMQRGVLQSFSGYAGKPSGGSQGTANTWEYSMTMRRTQFVPVPAGMSPEQFRIWEAFEAGESFVHRTCLFPSTLCSICTALINCTAISCKWRRPLLSASAT